jgi:hypothetical protein
MPAVSWPSDAIFSVCTRRSWARRRAASAASEAARARRGLEQAGVLDRQHGLRGEGLHQRDGGGREGAFGAAADHQAADHGSFPQQRYGEHGVDAGEYLGDTLDGAVLLHVVDRHGDAVLRAAAEKGFADADAALAQAGDAVLGHSERRFRHEHLLGRIELVDHALVGLRERHRAVDDGGKYGFQIERGIDGAQDFFQRLEFGDRACQFGGAGLQFAEGGDAADGDHRLLGEGLQQFDMSIGEGVDMRVDEHDDADRNTFAQQWYREQ